MRAKKRLVSSRPAREALNALGQRECTWAAKTLYPDSTAEDLSKTQRGPVRSLGLVTEHCLQSGSGDSVLSLWDVRSPTQPLRSLHTPDSG